MKRVIFLALIAGFLFAGTASGQSIRGSSFRDGHRFSYSIDEDTLKDTPSWDPEKGDIPLPLTQALRIARRNLNRFVPKANSNWLVREVTLDRIGEDKNKWIYTVEFYCYWSRKNCEDDAGMFTVYVKLDGTIVEPAIEPDTEPANMKSGPPIRIAPPKDR